MLSNLLTFIRFPNGVGQHQPSKANRYKNIHNVFNQDFYPTPSELIGTMIGQNDLQGKTILEPGAGKGYPLPEHMQKKEPSFEF